jgi:hypothetical protein
MKAKALLLPCGMFLGALALTAAWRHETPVDPGDHQAAGSVSAAPAPHTAPPSPAESLLADIRRLLRAGDLDGARVALLHAAETDPQLFFGVLRDFPWAPGMDDLISLAASGLPWGDRTSRATLNGIDRGLWRDIAWEGYIAAQIGKRPDEEIFAVATSAGPNEGDAPFRALVADAAEKRPKEFAAMLARQGRSELWSQYFAALMKVHPELAGEIYGSIRNRPIGYETNRPEIFEVMAFAQPTAENLAATMKTAGTDVSRDILSFMAATVYGGATAEERPKILEVIAQQSPPSRQSTVTQLISENASMSFEEFGQLVGVLGSGASQSAALRIWMGNHPDLDPGDRTWIDQLPTEKLKATANEMMDKRKP